MANNKKRDATIDIAIKYHVKGDELEVALKKADDRMIAAGLKTGKKLNRNQRAAYMKELRARAIKFEEYLKTEEAKVIAAEKKKIRKTAQLKRNARTKELRENRTFLDKLGRNMEAFRLKQKRANERASKGGGFMASVAGGFQNFGKKLGTISSYGAAITIINKLRQALTFAVESAVKFEAAFADLQAKSGQTNEEMRALQENIFKTAQVTKFSTLEIIEATTQLAKMGFSAEELADVLPAVATAADATGESIALVGETVAKTIRAFEYSSKSARLVADTLVKAFNRSALDVQKYANAISYVGSIAAQTHTSLNTMTASMEILADRGVTASKIGTGLRNIILKMSEAGLDLDDVLEKISKGQLDVLTLANVVGRRAANQLSILADNYDVLQEKVKGLEEVTNDAAKAAAIQQETFSAQWKILINNVQSYFDLLSNYDDGTKDFREGMKRDLGFMEKINTFFDEGASAAKRYIDKFPEFITEYKKMQAELKEGGHDSSHEAVLSIMGFHSLKDGDLSQSLLENEQEVLEAVTENATKIKEGATNEFKRIVDKQMSTLDAESGQTFLESLIGMNVNNMDAKLTAMKLSDKAKETIRIFTKDYRDWSDDGDFKKIIADHVGFDPSSYVETLLNEAEIRKQAISKRGGDVYKSGDLNKDALAGMSGSVLAENVASLKVNMQKYREIAAELCQFAPEDAAKAGITCKVKKDRQTKEKAQVENFQADLKNEEAYLIARDNLKTRYGNTDDVNEQQVIKGQLVALERKYRGELAIEYEAYLIKVRKLQEDYGLRNPNEENIYDSYVKGALRGASASRVKGIKNINDESGGGTLKTKKFEADYNAEQSYLRKVSELRLEAGNPEATPERKKEIQAELIELNNAYYDKLIIDFKVFLMDVETAIDDAGEDVDTTAAEEILKNASGTIDSMKTKNNKANKSAENVDKDDEPMHWTEIANYAIDGASQVADIYQMFADEKVRIAQEANQRELEAIEERYNEELGMQNAALEAGIISQEQAEIARQSSEKKKIQRMNAENKKLFEIEKKAEIQKLKIDGALNAARAFTASMAMGMPTGAILGGIASALVLAETAAAVSIAGRRKFVPKKFADGGIVEGASHAQGGVPFTVQGQGGYEMEGGEYIVNKKAAAANFAELERINGKANNRTHFATGGSVQPVNGISTDMSQAILSALREPVRAFVTDQDLKEAQSERDALTSKTTY